MPYAPDEFPPEIADLPKDARSAWVSVFNSTWRTFPGTEQEKEEAARAAAWITIDTFWKDEVGASVAPATMRLRKSISALSTPPLFGVTSRTVKFTSNLMEATERITYGEVFVPYETDAHGDLTVPEVIQRAAHGFMDHQEAGVQHKGLAGKGKVVESFITRAGDRDFEVPGSWVLGVKWNEPEWQRILNGELLGYSLDGVKTFVPIVAGREFAKPVSKYAMAIAKDEEAEPERELLDDPEKINTNPRVIKLMTNLLVTRVDGVSLPANRKQWKLFKSIGGAPKMAKRIVRVVGAAAKQAPGGPWQKLYDQLIGQGLSPEEALEFVIETFGPDLPPGWNPLDKSVEKQEPGDELPDPSEPQEGTDLVVSFAECSAQVDALMGQGSGVPVCSLMQAKHPAGPEGGIMIPTGTSLEQLAQECATAGQQAGFIQLQEAPADAGLMKSIVQGIGKILTRLGAKEPTEQITVKEDLDPMTAEERKAIDDRFAGIEKMLGDIHASIKGTTTTPAPAAVAPVAAAAASPAPVDGGAYQPSPAEAGADLIEIAKEVSTLKAMIEDMRGDRGRSSVQEILSHPAHKGLGGSEDSGRLVHSQIIGTSFPAAARQAQINSNKARQEKKRARREAASRISLRMG